MANHHLFLAAVSLIALAGCKEKQSPAETATHFQAAKDLYASKDYSHALVEVQYAIKGDPKSGDAHYLAAQIHEGLGNQKASFEEYARAAQPEANNVKAQLKVVDILLGANQLDAALGRINSTIGARPNDSDALALRALVEQRQGNREKARGDAQASLARSPGQASAAAVMAIDALQDKNSDKALAVIAQGLKAHAGDVRLVRLKAAALVMQDKKDEAIALYRDLVQAEPTSASLSATLAELEGATGHVDDGEKILRDGIAAAPADRDMRLALVSFMAKARGPEAGDKELQAAIAAQPKDSTFDLVRAEQLVRVGKVDQAIETLQTAIGRVPEGTGRSAAQIGLARIHLSQGDDAAARKLLDDAVAAKPDNDDALLMRAGLMVKSGDTAHAIPDLLAVASRKPRSAAPLALLAEAYGRQGDTDKAVDAVKKVIYFEPTNLAPVTQLASFYATQNKPDLAKQVLADYATRNPTSLDGRLAQVRMALHDKDWGGAQGALDQMRRIPKSERAMALLTGEMNEAKGNPAVAATGYMKMIDPAADKPLDRDAATGYARSAVAAKQTDKAIAFLSTAASEKTGDDAAFLDLLLAALYRSAGQEDKALEATASAIKVAPKQPAPYLESAGALRQSQPDRAVAVLNDGLAAGAPSEPLLMARATLEEQAGNKDAAIATYRDVMKVNPRSVVAANNYASLVADAKPNDKPLLTDARLPIQRFADASNPSILDTLAWLDYRLGDYQSAKTLLTRAKAETSDNPQLRFHYGAVLMALGDKDAGRSAVKAALGQQFPGHAEAERMMTE